MAEPNWENRTIFTGDNLEILRGFPDETIDLIYLDPPFNSKHDYAAPIGSRAAGAAFKDTWTLADVDVAWWGDIAESNPKLYKILDMTRDVAGKSSMSYLIYMAIRIMELHRVLKDAGSIYLHCDPTMSHYLKLVMDSVFGNKNFKNEIIWKRATGNKGSQHLPKKFGSMHDVLLFYSKDAKKWKFTDPKRPLTQQEADEKFTNKDENGDRWLDGSSHLFRARGQGARPNLCYEWRGFRNPHPSGWRLSEERLEEEYSKSNIRIIEDEAGRRKLQWRIYEKDYDGENINDLWDDILPASGPDNERSALSYKVI